MADLTFTKSKEEMKKNFSSGFASFMERRKYTPPQIADALGVSESAVNGWKYGRSFPDVPNLLRLFDLGLSPFEIMSEELKTRSMINYYERCIYDNQKMLNAIEKPVYRNAWECQAVDFVKDELIENSKKKQEWEAHLKSLMDKAL